MTGATVYRFYDAQGRLLYVGSTSTGAHRWTEHSRYQAWWSEVATVRVAHLPDRDSALVEERRAIRDENPLHNAIRYDGKPARLGAYGPYGGGSVYQRRRDGHWIGSVRRRGKRYTFHRGGSREAAVAAVAEFLAAAT